MKTQLEFLKEIVALLEEKPTIKVIFMVTGDLQCEDFDWAATAISSVEVKPFYQDNYEKILNEEDDIVTLLSEDMFSEVTDDDEAVRLAEEYFKKEVGEAVYVGLSL